MKAIRWARAFGGTPLTLISNVLVTAMFASLCVVWSEPSNRGGIVLLAIALITSLISIRALILKLEKFSPYTPDSKDWTSGESDSAIKFSYLVLIVFFVGYVLWAWVNLHRG